MAEQANKLSSRQEVDGLDPEEKIQEEKTKSSTDKKCPDCGGPMVFSPKIGKMLCEYCEHTEEIEVAAPAKNDEKTTPAKDAKDAKEKSAAKQVVGQVMEMDLNAAEHRGNCDWGTKKKVVRCKSCGAEAVYDALQVADSCPYCDSTQVMEEADKDTMAPNGVCPFIITKEEARKKFKEWISGLWFRPNDLKKDHFVESFNGIYMPFWTFDSDTDSTYQAEYGKDRTETDSEGNSKTVTDWYKCHGTYKKFFDDVLIVATDRHDKEVIKGLEPFDTDKSLPYKPEYVAGYVAERYSVGLDDSWKRGQKRIASDLDSQITMVIRHKYGADSVRSLKISTEHNNVTYKYLMLPLWLSNFHYKNKVYHFMVNGRTGAVDGYAPWSWWKIGFLILTILLILCWLWSSN